MNHVQNRCIRSSRIKARTETSAKLLSRDPTYEDAREWRLKLIHQKSGGPGVINAPGPFAPLDCSRRHNVKTERQSVVRRYSNALRPVTA